MRRFAQIFQANRYFVGAVATLALLWFIGPQIAINTSASLPKGFYFVKRYDAGQLKRGDIVLFFEAEINSFASERGYIREGEPIGKIVAALEGDMVSIDSNKVVVLGKVMSEKAPQIDSKGRKMKMFYYEGTVPKGSLFLIGETKNSFDSRYYGFIDQKNITAILTPLIVW